MLPSVSDNMGTRHSSIQPADADALIVSHKKISVKDEIIKRKNKTKTGVVLIIAMCCSTVINTVESEDKPDQQNEEASSESNITKPPQNFAPKPKKPLNSRPRVRSYGYRFTRVSPLILSVDDLEDFSKQNGDEELPSPEVNEPKPDFHSKVEQGN